MIAHNKSGINNITDLKGKRLNIGNPGSGTRGTWEVLEEALGWKRSDLRLASEMKSAETGQAVCDRQIDAYFWLVGHPSALTQESLATCDAVLVNVTGDAIDAGMDPLEVGRIVVAAVRRNDRYILTQAGARTLAEQRCSRILAAFDAAAERDPLG